MLGIHAMSRRSFIIAFAALSSLFLIFTFSWRRPVSVTLDSNLSPVKSPTTAEEASALCKARSFKPYNHHRKVYDLFLFSYELDWLEIRLHTLAPYVDYFVIVESSRTFTGLEKPLQLNASWDNFSKFHDKIIYKVIDDPGESLGSSSWAHEEYQRNSLLHNTFPSLLYSEKEAQEGDILIISDVDEIPKPQTINILRHCDIPDRLTLRSHFYYYSFQWQHVGQQWQHPQATVFHGLHGTLTPNDLRMGRGGVPSRWPFYTALQRWWQQADMWDAAWHCSSCFATMAEMRAKMEAFSHTNYNTAENRDEATMMDRVRNGQDLFGRWGERYERIENNQDVPKYVLKHQEQYEYLLNRDGENAGFSDWRSQAS